MKLRYIFLPLAAICSLLGAAQPKLSWIATVHDFGAFKEDIGIVTTTFRAVNAGNAPLTVLNARANCGCTRPTYPKLPVQPGDTLEISVSYDPTGRPGRFDKKIQVETTAGTGNLLIKGTVIGSPNTLATRYPVAVGPARISNEVTPFGQATKGKVLAAAINIYNTSDSTIHPAVTDLPPYVHALFRPHDIKRGEQGVVSLTAYTADCPDYGVITDSFYLIPDSVGDPATRHKISTTIIVNEDFSKLTPRQKAEAPKSELSTEMVDFGHITPGNGTKTLSFTITNRGKQKMIIRRIFTADDAIELHIDHTKIDPGKSATVKVTVDRSKLSRQNPLNARITIIANTPDTPSRIMRVVGQTDK